MKQYKKFFTGPRKLLLALSVLLCVWFGTAYGASAAGGDYTENEISMDVVCGYDGHVKGGRYLPVQVILTNGQETDSAGQIQIKTLESNNDIYQHDYPVEVPVGERVEKHLFLPVGNRSDQIFVSYVDGNGRQLAHKRVKLEFGTDTPELFVGILSDTPEKLSCWDGIGVDYSMMMTRTMTFTTENFPDNRMGLDMVDMLIISNYRIRDLSEDQSRTLVEWVRNGGIMVLGTGMRVDDTLGRFAPELLEQSYDAPQVEQISMGAEYDQEGPSDADLEIPCVEFLLSGGTVIQSDESRTLFATVPYSQGIIAVAAYDLTDIEGFCIQNPSFMDHVLTQIIGETRLNRLAEEVYSGDSGQYWSVRNVINTGNVRRLPNMALYAMEIIIYIILAGLGLYIFLRQRDLSQLYRSSVVVLSLIFTVIIYLMGNRTRFRDVFYTYAQFQEVSWDSVSENVYMNMRAPYSRPYQVELQEGYTVKPVTGAYYYGNDNQVRFTGDEACKVDISHLEDATRVTLHDVPAFEPRYFQMDKTVKNEDQIGFYGSLEIDHGKISGEITSQFKEKMENCTVFFNDKLIYLGDVEPGQTVEVGNYPVLEYPQNHSFDVASYLSGQSAFDQADIEDDAYVEAVEKTNLLSFYLDYYMPSYLSAARVVGIKTNSGSHNGLIRAGDVEGRTVASSNVDVYSSEDEILYRQATQRQPKVISGNYDENSNALFGMDPVTLEYSLGSDIWIQRLTMDFVSDEFLQNGSGTLLKFSGNIYFYNHSTGSFDKQEPAKRDYDSADLAPYLSPGNTITVKYVYENNSEYNWDVLLPVLNVMGRTIDDRD